MLVSQDPMNDIKAAENEVKKDADVENHDQVIEQ